MNSPETVLQPVTSKKAAVKLFEELSDEKIQEVKTAGRHRKIELSNDKTLRLVFQDEPLKKFGEIFEELHWTCAGVSLSKTAFQQVLQKDYDLVAHVTRDANVYISTPQQWRDFLNDHNTLWETEKTSEKVISMPLEELKALQV